MRERGPSKELKKLKKKTRLKAIKKQLVIARGNELLCKQMPVFTLLPTEERIVGKGGFKRLKEVTIDREGNLITHLAGAMDKDRGADEYESSSLRC